MCSCEEKRDVALSLEQKKAVVEEVAEIARSAHSAVAAEYRGLTVTQMTVLREKAKQSGVYLRVVRNTLARRAVEGTEFECVQDRLKGPLVLAFSRDEPGAAARVVRDYAKTNNKLVVSFVAFDGRAMDAPAIDQLASLPTREEALAMLMSVLLAPATKLVRTVAEPHARLARVVDAMRAARAETA
jgi:large subunit ribosomal protein L10